MTKEIAEKLVGLTSQVLIRVVSRWGTMPIMQNIDTAPFPRFLAWLGRESRVVSLHSILKIEPFAGNCGVTAKVYLDLGRNCRVSLKREIQRYHSIIIGDFQISTADEFDNCIRLVLTDYLMRPEQALATPSGSVWQQHS